MAFLSVDLLPAVEGSWGGGSMVVETPDIEMIEVSPRVVSDRREGGKGGESGRRKEGTEV